jgi:hypothetical protein
MYYALAGVTNEPIKFLLLVIRTDFHRGLLD